MIASAARVQNSGFSGHGIYHIGPKSAIEDKMKRILSKVKGPRGGDERSSSPAGAGALVAPQGDGPEAVVVREVIAFCEAGAPGSGSAGEEYLHLPAIVDGAESSPAAAKEAAVTIRRYLSKEHFTRGFAQYNAIMLMRILTDNPGRNFTQNFDKDFVGTIKKLLRDTGDQGVQQILRETLDYFEADKAPGNSTLGPLMDMWRKEKGLGAQLHTTNPAGRGIYVPGGGGLLAPATGARQGRRLPQPDELAARVEEAKTTARLLVQTIQSTPVAELQGNELVKEFAVRARAAQKSISGYMQCEDPAPDDDTMMTLIETNEQLNIAMSKHHRAVLAARKQGGQNTPNQQNEANNYMTAVGSNAYAQAQQQPRTNGFGSQPQPNTTFTPPPGPPPNRESNLAAGKDAPDNPFTDAARYEQEDNKPKSSFSLFSRSKPSTTTNAEQMYKPYQPSPVSEGTYSSQNTQPSQPESRPSGFGSVQSTPSYLDRQDSAANNVTMHGASPPQQPQDHRAN